MPFTAAAPGAFLFALGPLATGAGAGIPGAVLPAGRGHRDLPLADRGARPARAGLAGRPRADEDAHTKGHSQ
jgi:hypothetical protein